MKLPNRVSAVIPDAKVTDYLLSASHPYGRHKAVFFRLFGFSADSPETLATALHRHAEENDVASEDDSPFGQCYIVEGALNAPDGRTPMVRVIWFVETGEESPRLVTVYPLERGAR